MGEARGNYGGHVKKVLLRRPVIKAGNFASARCKVKRSLYKPVTQGRQESGETNHKEGEGGTRHLDILRMGKVQTLKAGDWPLTGKLSSCAEEPLGNNRGGSLQVDRRIGGQDGKKAHNQSAQTPTSAHHHYKGRII